MAVATYVQEGERIDHTPVADVAAGDVTGDATAEEFSTLSLPDIISNVADKFLLQGFNAVESGWQELAAYRN